MTRIEKIKNASSFKYVFGKRAYVISETEIIALIDPSYNDLDCFIYQYSRLNSYIDEKTKHIHNRFEIIYECESLDGLIEEILENYKFN